MQSKQLPIGYWVKKVDELLTTGINEIQSSFGLTRTDWQALNSIKENEGIRRHDLITFMRPFADEASLNATFEKFTEDNLIFNEAEKFTLTENGSVLHKRCMEKQKVFRQKATANISD